MRYIVRSKEEGAGSGTISKSVDEAAAEVEKDFKEGEEAKEEKEEKEEEDDKDEEKDDKKDDAESKDDEADEEELNAEEQIHAKNLFKLLKNKETAPQAIEIMVKAAGLELKSPESKKEEKEQKESIKDLIKTALGDKYSQFSEVFGPALESIITKFVDEKVETKTKDIREEQQAIKLAEQKKEIKAAQLSVLSEYQEVPVEVLKEVLRMQTEGEVRPGPKANNETFFRGCLIHAAANLKTQLVLKGEKQESSKTKDNEPKKKSTLNNLSNQRGSSKEGKEVTQVKSTKDAIELAIKQVDAQFQKA